MLRHARRCVLAVVVMAALALAFSHGSAKAALPTGDTINQTTDPSTNWQGMLYAIGMTTDPTLCTPQAADPGNAVCDHFQLTTQTSGPVRSVITWPNLVPGAPGNDFDLLVCLNVLVDTSNDNCTGGIEIAEDFGNGPTAMVTWNAAAGTTYEIRVIPFFVFGSDYQGCAAYTNSNDCPAPAGAAGGTPQPAAAFFQGCQPGTVGDRKFNGNGDITTPTTDPNNPDGTDGKYAMNVERKSDSNGMKINGKVSYKEKDPVLFKSQQITCATFQDQPPTGTQNGSRTNGRVTIRGFGQLKTTDDGNSPNSKQPVCYEVSAGDNADPGAGSDDYSMTLLALTQNPDGTSTCGAIVLQRAGVITKGNNSYKIPGQN